MGTAAHSWVLSFPTESEAFEKLQRLLEDKTVQLLDTYDTIEAAKLVARMGGPLWGVRLDSGDFLALSREVRRILPDAKIMASGDLDETKIAWLLEQGAPIDAFGVGTELAVSGDAPSMGAVYKLVEIEQEGHIRHTAKRSPDKATIPGAKQLFRYPEYDLLSLHDECAGGAKAMLEPWILGGNLIRDLPSVEDIRDRAQKNLAEWPAGNRRTELSIDLKELNESVLRH
jgi:nicotinate phosphoribosyltransferase